MLHTLKRFTLTLVLCCATLVAMAATQEDPVAMLQTASNQMLTALQQNKATIKTNPALVEQLARQILLPHVNTDAMAKLAIGRNGWLSATPAQQQQFKQAFTTLMIRTYSTALASYSNQSIHFDPIRGNISNAFQIQVNSKIIQPGGPSIPVNYRLISQNGTWQVYDMTVDGVSMVQSFRSQFAQQLNNGGMPALLAAMSSHNARLAK